jgi:hypothetical protein
MTTRNFQLRPFSNVYKVHDKFGVESDTWSKFFSEEKYPSQLKNVFDKTLYSFKVKNISINETLHRLALLNQVKLKNSFLKERPVIAEQT